MFVSKQIELLVEHDRIVVRWVSEKSAEPPGEHTLAVPVPGHVSLAAFGIELETKVFDRSQSTPELIAQCGPNRQFFDGEKLCGDLYVRRKLPGDYFYPLGLSGRKKLSDYFTDEKYPRERRQRTALLLSGDHIMWIIGGAIDERFKLTDATRNVLEVQCARIDQTV
jgi:tRNA(Ile)-lysidine synthase